MSELETGRSGVTRFSLLHLLSVTALVAITIAVVMAYRKNRSMTEYRDELFALSSRTRSMNEGKLTSAALPRVADDYLSWNVSVPEGEDYELRLGMGDVSEVTIPTVMGAVPLPAGQHRVTLYTGDSPSEDFRYVVFVDGKPAIEKTMGSEWIPGGWSSASGLSWPRGQTFDPAPLQLSSMSYQERPDVGKDNYFNGQRDDYVTQTGYRLWIDTHDRAWDPPSPFIGFDDGHGYYGIGLRDGVRFKSVHHQQYEWAFTRPQLQTEEPVWRIAAEFFTEEGASLKAQTPSFQSWQLRGDAGGEKGLSQPSDLTGSVYSAFLQAKHGDKDAPQPSVELQWDASRPDEVGLRIADFSANDSIRSWRLRIHGGTQHLWRELKIGERMVLADELVKNGSPKRSEVPVTLDGLDSSTPDIHFQWQTNEVLPLQIVSRQQKAFPGMNLYDGLPVAFGIKIPIALKPTLEVNYVAQDPTNPGQPFPGGAVFEEICFELDATKREWIWLETKPK